MVQLFTGEHSLREVILFPALRERQAGDALLERARQHEAAPTAGGEDEEGPSE
jgi:hypothetical protein